MVNNVAVITCTAVDSAGNKGTASETINIVVPAGSYPTC
jgi:hypothetical protein